MMKSRVITVSAISAGLVAICLAIGIYVEIVDLISLVLSSVFVILPLYLKSYKGALLTYLAGGVLGLLIGWFNFVYSFVFPAYFAFFGLFPIIACLLREKKINKFFYHTIGLIWGLAAAYGVYFYYTLVMGLDFANLPHYLIWIKDYLIVVVGVVGVVFYFVYERFITLAKTLIDKYMGKIIK
ncbi:MAG: hypothetical protein IJQ07_04790 [Clostridia bacterium]|nr:hypothetical protein [Clostridia bacterium]